MTIARLLLADPQVVFLDEATWALDSTFEAAVQQALDEALSGCTCLVIAHRLSTIRAADAICVLEQGRILERGTHAELLARQGAMPSCIAPSSARTARWSASDRAGPGVCGHTRARPGPVGGATPRDRALPQQ